MKYCKRMSPTINSKLTQTNVYGVFMYISSMGVTIVQMTSRSPIQDGRHSTPETWPRGYKTWVHSQKQNKAQWLAACGHMSASSQSLRFILSLRLYSSFIISRPGGRILLAKVAICCLSIRKRYPCKLFFSLRKYAKYTMDIFLWRLPLAKRLSTLWSHFASVIRSSKMIRFLFQDR